MINPVITLTITDFRMFQEETLKETLLTRFELIEQQHFIKYSAGEMEIIPETFDPCLLEALTFIDESNMSEAELEAQYKRKEFIYIQKSSLTLARKNGLEEGRKEGEIKAKEEVAINLLALEMPISVVAKTTGLSVEIITKLAN